MRVFKIQILFPNLLKEEGNGANVFFLAFSLKPCNLRKLEFDIYSVIMKPQCLESKCYLFSYLGATAWLLWTLPYRAVPACLALSCLEPLTSLMSLVLCILIVRISSKFKYIYLQ